MTITRFSVYALPVKSVLCTILTMLLLAGTAATYAADSTVYVQCPQTTDLHPTGTGSDGSAIRCDHLTAGDGMVTMADDGATRQYVFGFNRVALPGEVNEETGETVPTDESGNYPGYVMSEGTMSANAPAPTIVVNEDDELFLSLTNTGMIQRPDLFDPHTVHWHGFPQASSIFDGVPDASISIGMGATLTYYYNVKDAGTYMYHCHVEATEHMQMGMLGNLYVRPRQNRCDVVDDNLPGGVCPPNHVIGETQYAYNDGDGSTWYDVDYPIQLGSFDPDFHDASFTTQPLPFAAMKDRFFMLNGRGYPDTTVAMPLNTVDTLGVVQESQPVSSLIEAKPGDRVLLRISNLNVTQFNTLGIQGLTMEVIALDARLLRDQAAEPNNMYYKTNSVTLGGGQSVDAIITIPVTATPGDKFYLYSTNLDQLANNTENFGGAMTEIRIN